MTFYNEDNVMNFDFLDNTSNKMIITFEIDQLTWYEEILTSDVDNKIDLLFIIKNCHKGFYKHIMNFIYSYNDLCTIWEECIIEEDKATENEILLVLIEQMIIGLTKFRDEQK